HLGLMFLAPGAVFPGLPEQFAKPAAFGDLLAAILALVALAAVVRRSSLARPLVGLFNIVGTIDLINAISLATIYAAPPYMGPAYWIPAFWVPALLATHYVIFVLLGKRWYGPVTARSTSHPTGCERTLIPAFVACGSGAYAAPWERMSASG